MNFKFTNYSGNNIFYTYFTEKTIMSENKFDQKWVRENLLVLCPACKLYIKPIKPLNCPICKTYLD